jgi:hypothetical protein
MSEPRKEIRDPDLRHADAALRRTAARARELGRQTNTPVYVLRNGKIIDLTAEANTPQADSGTGQPKRS